MGLEKLKSVFAENLGNNKTPAGGRHGEMVHPQGHSQLDNFQPFLAESIDSLRLINIKNGAINIPFKQQKFNSSQSPSFPSSYTPLNTIIDNEFTSKLGDSLRNHGWPDLYNANHTSKNIDSPSPRSSNPYQPFQYGNPNISSILDMKGPDGKFGMGARTSVVSAVGKLLKSTNFLGGSIGSLIDGVGDFVSDLGKEPYIVSRLPKGGGLFDLASFTSGRTINSGGRLAPLARPLVDTIRIAKYLTSPSGLLELALKNAHVLVPSNVVRSNNKLIKTPQRFNAGYNPLAMLVGAGARLIGQGVPNFMLKSGFSSGYGEESSIFDILGTPGDTPTYKLNSTFVSADMDFYTNKIPDAGDTSSGFGDLGGIGTVAKTSTGDKMTLAPMIKGNSLDNLGGQTTGLNDGDNKLSLNIEAEKEGMPFYFKDLRDNSYIFFRAYLEGLTEEISPSWAETNYIGRSESVYVYERAVRTLSFTLKLHAQTRRELPAIYEKINKLTSLCYPEYAKDERLADKTRMKPPLTKFRLGEMFGSSGNELMGFIDSLSYVVPEESTWETTEGARVPKFVMVTISYKVIHGEVPSLSTNFYGYPKNNRKISSDPDAIDAIDTRLTI